LYSKPREEGASPPDASKYVRIGIVVAIGLIIFAIVGNQGIIMSMNISEFEEKFTKPLFYGVISAVILSGIALIRVNIVKRSSIFWFCLNTAITFLNRGTNDPIAKNITSFRDFKLSIPSFVIWQITKVLLFGAFFANIMFGFATMYIIDGNYLGIDTLPTLFQLPFITPPTDPSYAFDNVTPMIPSLLVLVPPILGVIGLRLVLYVGLHSLIGVITTYIQDTSEGKPRFLNYISTIEGIIGVGILWVAFNMFFTDQIDYNTRYAIGGTKTSKLGIIGVTLSNAYDGSVGGVMNGN